jgi:hypothetical protein
MHEFVPSALDKLHHLNALPWPDTFSNEGLTPRYNKWTKDVFYTNDLDQILIVNKSGQAEVMYSIGGYQDFIQCYMDDLSPDDFTDAECNEVIQAAITEGAQMSYEWRQYANVR